MIRAWTSSIAIRQAIVSTAVVLAAIAAFALFALLTVERGARADLLRTIDTDIAGLADGMAQGGPAELRQRIADRIDFRTLQGAASYYRLTGADGKLLAGNLRVAPPLNATHSATADVVQDDDPILARGTVLRGNLTLVVGRSLGPIAAMKQRLVWIFAVTGLVTVLLSLLVGAVVARRMTARITALNTQFTAFARGEHRVRPPASPARDEIDLLAGHVEHHLVRIEDLLRAQRDVTDNIAHELRTPLVHLDTRLLHALDRNTDSEVTQALEDARDNVRSIVSLFDALLDIALAEPGNGANGLASFDLSELAAGIAELYTASAEEAGFDFSTRIAPGIAMRGEPMQISRLIANLLDNAFKYVPSGSRIRLSIAEGPAITVEDNGPGVDAADREMIFQRFRRSGGPAGGHGLGLALVRVIAARHGLAARAEDAGPGARFVIAPARAM